MNKEKNIEEFEELLTTKKLSEAKKTLKEMNEVDIAESIIFKNFVTTSSNLNNEIIQNYRSVKLAEKYCNVSSQEVKPTFENKVEQQKPLEAEITPVVESEKEVKAKEEAGMPYTIRVKVPANKTYEFNDMIRGRVSFESEDIGDWVLIKANGIPTYNFAVVIDDHTMDITHVFRGEEHLSNTPKQLMIYEMLGWEAPKFGHMTIIVNENHKKLSKRDNSIMQ